MLKNITGGSTISYGPVLPTAAETFDGTLFYKNTDSDQGLYIFGFNQDANPTLVGDQSNQGWSLVINPGLYVDVTGDIMTGDLVMSAGNLAIRSNNYIAINGDPMTFVGNSFVWQKTQSSGSGVTMRLTTAGVLEIGGNKVWHAGNDGADSGLDADLLDGRDSTFFRNATNLNTGTIDLSRLPYTPVQQGGISGQGTNKVSIGWGAETSQLYVNVDSVNYKGKWPIDINGNAATANYANVAGTANALSGRITADQLPLFLEVIRPVEATTTAVTIDMQGGDFATIFDLKLASNTGVRFTNFPNTTSRAFTWTLVVTNDATAGRSLAFQDPIKWAGGEVPNRTTAANAVDIYTFVRIGAVIYGSLSILDAR